MRRANLKGAAAVVFALLLFAGDADAGFKKLGTAGFTFLKVSQSARSAAMGDAYTAVADDINSIFRNPAGLTGIERMEYMFTYTTWLVDSKFYSAAVAYRAGTTVWGVSVVALQLPGFEETTIFKPQGTGRVFNNSDIAVGGTFAVQLTDKMSVGGTIRFIQSKLGAEKLTGISMGVGTQFYTGFRSLRIGMSMKNLGGETTVVSLNSTMPTVFHVGTAMELVGELGDPVSVTGAFEGAYFTDRWQRWNLGGEMWVRNMLALRAGWKFRYDEESWSIGAGLKGTVSGHTFNVDFSYSDFGDLFEAPVRLTLSGTF